MAAVHEQVREVSHHEGPVGQGEEAHAKIRVGGFQQQAVTRRADRGYRNCLSDGEVPITNYKYTIQVRHVGMVFGLSWSFRC